MLTEQEKKKSEFNGSLHQRLGSTCGAITKG